ncbi:ribosome hibernation-promoting factor, HPF/YfiA family [Fundicoccus culcitae]|uniref:Ribosome hibernation promoting factor n=1 Tax=Fundicoccus culcitae TaxID=2969821 RepID=A0ABY5P3B4_9LACT|nr:ribosome-associated translation inhibitor RaiA [Fundicoccus culcitae]UUX32938.1 ribosome-associated translation inhibitor RaiA [Fundicoccus culcitae]
MFTYNVRGENIEVTKAIRDYAEKKVAKLERFFEDVPDATAYVNLKVYPDKTAKAEVTIPLSFLVLRAEETTPDLYASIDFVVDKLERQVRKYKTKINRKSREKGYSGISNGANLEAAEAANQAPTTTATTEPELEIVRSKRINLKPMDSEEAVLQMNMLGHDFFIYTDAETMDISIVYRRKDGRYGLIETTSN